MAETTNIEWCDATWSPWEGCTKVSPGCDHCYAEGMNRWLRKGENWGPGAPRRIYGSDHWDKPIRWNKAAEKAGKRLSVFPSVCDPFDNEVAPIIRTRFFELIERTPWIDWLLLTKRIGNAAQMMFLARGGHLPLLPNVRIGATIVNREEMLRDAAKLKSTPARVRFWSVEPMLGDLGEIPRELMPDWVIVGGESGHGARPMHPDWARSLRDQCAAAGVPFMFKQHGEWIGVPDLRHLPYGIGPGFGAYDHCKYDREHESVRVGKKAAGRLLDGVTHDGFPEVSR